MTALTGEGLFAVDVGEPLSPAVFAALLARGQAFAIKADYRGLPPPIEELDLVHLQPDVVPALPRGTLVLRVLDDGGFEFTRTPPRVAVWMVPATRVRTAGCSGS